MLHLTFFDSCHFTGNAGRYHIITAAPQQWLTLQDNQLVLCAGSPLSPSKTWHNPTDIDVWQALAEMQPKTVVSDLPFCGGLAGLLGYEFGRLAQLRRPSRSAFNFPDLAVGYYPWALIQDNHSGTACISILEDCHSETRAALIKAISSADDTSFTRNSQKYRTHDRESLAADISPADYHKAFHKIQAYLQAGDCYQINYTQRFSHSSQVSDPISLYRQLREKLPGPMAGFLAVDKERALLSFSPERLVSCQSNNVLAQPIKGTAPRSSDAALDRVLADNLCNSTKDQAENLMIVDLLRNDLGKVCEHGTIAVPALFSLEHFENVHHLVSNITGRLAANQTPLDLLEACFPGGSVTGAPKKRAMEIIDELEDFSREAYCGSLFYLSANDNLDANITIRSLVASPQGLACWGGGGITVGSEANAEYEESLTKVTKLIKGTPPTSVKGQPQ